MTAAYWVAQNTGDGTWHVIYTDDKSAAYKAFQQGQLVTINSIQWSVNIQNHSVVPFPDFTSANNAMITLYKQWGANVGPTTSSGALSGNQWTTRNAHNGNRWWVAYNVGQSIFSKNLYSPSGYESVGSGNATDDAIFQKAARATAKLSKPFEGGKGPVIHVQNVGWANVNGQPGTGDAFVSYDAAQAFLANLQAQSPAPGTATQVGQQAAATASAAGVDLSNLWSFLSKLSGKQLWIRAAEIVVGVILVAIGLKSVAAGTPVGNIASKALGKLPQGKIIKKVVA